MTAHRIDQDATAPCWAMSPLCRHSGRKYPQTRKRALIELVLGFSRAAIEPKKFVFWLESPLGFWPILLDCAVNDFGNWASVTTHGSAIVVLINHQRV